MSYTRSYTEVVSKTVTINFPPSQNGGSRSETVSIPVDVVIHVDTSPFDSSIKDCNYNVNLLTGAIVATEAAEIVAKERNAKKVADSVISGFFGYIRSEISQQISELTQSVDAQVMHLQDLMKSCMTKKEQMEGDFMRISSRYEKTFADLNHELSNRISELDKQAFTFKKVTNEQTIRNSGNDLVSTIAVFGSESGALQGKLSASIAKKRAHQTLDKATLFLWQQKQLNSKISQSMINGDASMHYVPTYYIETSNVSGKESEIITTDYFAAFKDNAKPKIMNQFVSPAVNWMTIPAEQKAMIARYFNIEADKHSFDDPHIKRLSQTINSIANIDALTMIVQY